MFPLSTEVYIIVVYYVTLSFNSNSSSYNSSKQNPTLGIQIVVMPMLHYIEEAQDVTWLYTSFQVGQLHIKPSTDIYVSKYTELCIQYAYIW